jgi:hypothetical protein
MRNYERERAEAAREEEELLSAPRPRNRPFALAALGLALMIGGYMAADYTLATARQAEVEQRMTELRLLTQQRKEAGADDGLAERVERAAAPPRREFPYQMAGRLAIYAGLFLFVLAGIQMYHSSPPSEDDTVTG